MAAAKTFRGVRKLLAPRWLTEGDGELIGYSLDLMKDAFARRIELGLYARMPQTDPSGTPAPPGALAAMGRDRRVVRGINETDRSYAYRLTQWLVDRKRAGNPFALLKKLAEYTGSLCSFRTVDNSGNWYSRAADGTETALVKQANWNWDGDATKWSRFWVIIYPNGLWTVGPGAWNDAATQGWEDETGIGWGSDIPTEHVSSLQAIVADWKPAGTRCVNIILAFDTASFDPASPEPDGTWGSWSKIVGGERVPARLASARYLDGVRT